NLPCRERRPTGSPAGVGSGFRGTRTRPPDALGGKLVCDHLVRAARSAPRIAREWPQSRAARLSSWEGMMAAASAAPVSARRQARHVTVFLDVDGVLNSYPVPKLRSMAEGRKKLHAWHYELHYRP